MKGILLVKPRRLIDGRFCLNKNIMGNVGVCAIDLYRCVYDGKTWRVYF